MILDLLVYNYTIYYSFFFLNYLNFKNIYLIRVLGNKKLNYIIKNKAKNLIF